MTRSVMAIGAAVGLWLLAIPADAGKVAIVVSRSLAPYVQALKGYEGKTIETLEKFNIEGDLQKGRDIFGSLSAADTSLAVAIGSEAVEAAKSGLARDIPLLYTMVLEAQPLPERKSYGVLMQIPADEQFGGIMKIFPGVSKIGVIYNSASSSDAIQQARAAAQTRSLVLLPIAVEGVGEIQEALDKLKHSGVEVIWSVADRITTQPAVITKIISYSRQNKLPFIGLSPYHVKAGALAAFSADFDDLGAQTAELAKKILTNTVVTQIQGPRKVIIYFNPETQNLLGLKSLNGLPGAQELK
ncbi:MAG: ABC transporter substrate binding protein [candidate division FCPU426 bacterium]